MCQVILDSKETERRGSIAQEVGGQGKVRQLGEKGQEVEQGRTLGRAG